LSLPSLRPTPASSALKYFFNAETAEIFAETAEAEWRGAELF